MAPLGSGWIYARVMQVFLQAQVGGVDFHKRNLVLIGHSYGGHSVYVPTSSHANALQHVLSDQISLLLDYLNKDFNFQNFLLLDATVGPNNASKKKMDSILVQMYWNKRDTWPSRAAARKEMTSKPGHRNWHPEVMDLFIVRVDLRKLHASLVG